MKYSKLAISLFLYANSSYAFATDIPVVIKAKQSERVVLPADVDEKEAQVKFVKNLGTEWKLAEIIGASPSKAFSTTKIDSNQLTKTIKNVKSTVCTAITKGDVKVFFSFDADAKIFGIGASSEAGIEVTFKC